MSWDDQRAFLAVLEEGSLSAAARRLGLSHPTVRSRIEALEASLGTILFTRSPNGLVPTETATALAEPARTMMTASDLFVRLASASPGDMAGTIRLSVPEFMGVEVIPCMLRKLRDTYPAIEIELSLSNKPADLLTQEVDLAVRTIAPHQAALVARKVSAIPLGLFAAQAYLNERGWPKTISDLVDHDLIGPDRSRSDLELLDRIIPTVAQKRFLLRSDSHPAQLAAARAGLGIAATQVPVGDNDPILIRVLPDLVVATLDTWIVTHEDLQHVPRVRAVFDSLVSSFIEYGRTGIG